LDEEVALAQTAGPHTTLQLDRRARSAALPAPLPRGAMPRLTVSHLTRPHCIRARCARGVADCAVALFI
jgi:hypothetical protein